MKDALCKAAADTIWERRIFTFEPGRSNKYYPPGWWAMLLTELEAALRPIARERIAKGQLPRKEPSRILGGPGSGQLCSLCDKPIERYQIEYDIEQPGATAQTFRFHTACEAIWRLECTQDDS